MTYVGIAQCKIQWIKVVKMDVVYYWVIHSSSISWWLHFISQFQKLLEVRLCSSFFYVVLGCPMFS
jgi:hypothetical protein